MTRFFKRMIFAAIIALPLTATAAQQPISFGIDCMIHDIHGKLLADLGMVGAMMNGRYTPVSNFSFSDLKVEANLDGPFVETPEVGAPQLKLTVTDTNGNILASVVTTATESTNAALFVPSRNVYLHCDKMEM